MVCILYINSTQYGLAFSVVYWSKLALDFQSWVLNFHKLKLATVRIFIPQKSSIAAKFLEGGVEWGAYCYASLDNDNIYIFDRHMFVKHV